MEVSGVSGIQHGLALLFIQLEMALCFPVLA